MPGTVQRALYSLLYFMISELLEVDPIIMPILELGILRLGQVTGFSKAV